MKKIILTSFIYSVVSVATFLVAGYVYAASIVSDDFSNYTNGSIGGHGGWNSYINGGNFVVQGSDGKLLYNNTPVDSVIYKSGLPISDGSQSVYIRSKDRTNWQPYGNGNIQVRISKGSWGGSELRNFIAISFKKDGSVSYYDPVFDTYRDFASFNDNEWTLVEFEWNSVDKKARYRINSGPWTDWQPLAGSGPFVDFDTVGFDFVSGGSGGVYVDNVGISSVPSPPPPPICTSFLYSNWSICSANSQQVRTVLASSPAGCSGGDPILTQSCTYTPPACDSWIYSGWSTCSADGKQARTVSSSSPSGCSGGSPVLSQSCTYTPPCSEDKWSCDAWNTCSADGQQSRNCTKAFDCPNGDTPSPNTSQSCTSSRPACSEDQWQCGGWGACSLDGIQRRTCRKTYDCPDVESDVPQTSQSCDAPVSPTKNTPPQLQQNNSGEVANQDAIIQATVKLLCPVDTQRASQGSGTVISDDGTILTNKHVIAGTPGCLVGFINDYHDEPYFGDRQIADIVKLSTNEDIAVLKIRNPYRRQLPAVNITSGNTSRLRLGTRIFTYGYPERFGTNITSTSGDFSGASGNYLKTTAIIEHGNSGGGAYLDNGTFVGIPSMVVKGELNAIGYVLSIDTINTWINNAPPAYKPKTDNNYSRVNSLLEDIDLKTLGSLKLFVADKEGAQSGVMKDAAPAKEKNGNVVSTPKKEKLKPFQKIEIKKPVQSMKSKDVKVVPTPDKKQTIKTEPKPIVEPKKEAPTQAKKPSIFSRVRSWFGR